MRKYQYYITGEDGDRDAYGVNWTGQTLTPAITHIISKVKLKLFRVGDPKTVTVSIKLASGGKPIGADLCSGTIEGTELTLDTNGEWYEIPLGNGFELEANTQYAIIVRAPDGDTSNKVSWRADIADATYTGGKYCSSSDSGIDWSTFSGTDLMFEEWGTGPPSPTTITWGSLLKSQISAEKIEEAIARMIQLHENDANAHIEEGESLQSHKASEIIDHLANSIIADKMKEWEIIKLAGNFKRSDFHWFTFFESVDGYYTTPIGTGTTTVKTNKVTLDTGATINSKAILSKTPNYLYAQFFNWTKKREFKTSIYWWDLTLHTDWIILGGEETDRHIGFKFINGILYGTVADGTTEATLQIEIMAMGGERNLNVVWTPGVSAEFFVDSVSKGTIETNLPSGLEHSNVMLNISIKNTEATTKFIEVSMWDFWQEV